MRRSIRLTNILMSQLKLSMQLVDQVHQFLVQHDDNARDPGVASQYMCAVIGCLLGQQDMPESQKEEILDKIANRQPVGLFVEHAHLPRCRSSASA